MKRDLFAFVSILMLFISCDFQWGEVEWHYTNSDGVRITDPKKFDYNRNEYRINWNTPVLIDTNSVYVIDSLYDKYDKETPIKKLDGHRFCRFFSGGQMLFYTTRDSLSMLALANDKNAGIPGYFTIDNDKLMMDVFQNMNGGQTGKYFGKIKSDSGIIFFEQRPETYKGSFKKLEAYGRQTIWKKVILDSMNHYKPDW